MKWRAIRRDVYPAPSPSPADVEQAWKILALVNEWIRHSEAKTAATLAASGVTGGLLFSLFRAFQSPTIWQIVCVSIGAAAAVTAFVCSAASLRPRLSWKKQQDTTTHGNNTTRFNPLFFQDVAHGFKGDHVAYVEKLLQVTGDCKQLFEQVCHQIVANSSVASRKFSWNNRALCALLVAVAALSGLAVTATRL